MHLAEAPNNALGRHPASSHNVHRWTTILLLAGIFAAGDIVVRLGIRSWESVAFFGIASLAAVLAWAFGRQRETWANAADLVARLQRADDLRDAIGRGLSTPMCAFDSDGRYVLWNGAAERLTGALAKDAIGKTYAELVGNRVDPMIAAAYARATRGETTAIEGRELTTASGARRTFNGSFEPLRDRDGSILGGMATFYDVTNERDAVADLQRFAEIVQQTDVPVAMADPRARLTYVNEAWTKMTGYSLEEVRGQTPGSLLQGPESDPETREAMRRAVREGVGFKGDVVNYRKNGETFIVALTSTPIRDASGKVTSYVAIERDVTALREEQRALGVERAFTRSLLDAASISVVACDAANRVVEWNPASVHLFGLSRQEALGRHIDEVALTPAPALRSEKLAEVFATGASFEMERDVILPNGGPVQRLELAVSPVRDPESGAVVYALCVMRDVTERRAAERALRESEAGMQSLIRSAASVIIGVRPDLTITEWNAAAERLKGLSRAEALGKDLTRLFPHCKTHHELCRFFTSVLSGTPVLGHEVQERLPNGELVVYRWNFNPIIDAEGRCTGLLAIADDVTERREAEERFRFLFDASSDAHLLVNKHGVIDCNRAALRMLGLNDRSEIIGVHPTNFAPEFQPDGTRSAAKGAEMVASLAKTGSHRFDWSLQRRDGKLVPVEVTLTSVDLNEEGGHLAVCHDLTERAEAEAAIRGERQRLLDAIEVLDSGLVMFDANERLLAYNKRFFESMQPNSAQLHIGMSMEELLRASLVNGRHAFTGEDGDTWTARMLSHARAARVGVEEQVGPLSLRVSVSRMRDGGTVALTTDISALKETQRTLERARDAERVANRAKSVFLANMSHELRTPLNSIIGFTKQVRKNKSGTIPSLEMNYLERVEKNGIHLLSVIDHLLDFSKIEAGKMRVDRGLVHVGVLASETVAQLEGQPRRGNVSLTCEAPSNLRAIESDGAKLRQILINLVGNALKFTHEGYVRVVVEGDDDGRPVAIEVRDSGIGIPSDRLDAIFHAFEQGERTTARDYGGTGLGLNISRSLCELLGATLTVESSVGVGATFRVELASGEALQLQR